MHVLRGAFLWRMFRRKHEIDYKKVVLILTGENRELDYYALAHLGDYMDRKYADGAVVLFDRDKTYQMAEDVLAEYGSADKKVCLCQCSRKFIEIVHDYYSFHKFFDNLVFTFASRPKDNLLGKVLEETQVNEEDAVCMGLYRLRNVPALRKRDKRI